LLILKKLGFTAHGVSNWNEALSALEKEPFDHILLDMQVLDDKKNVLKRE
jgi:CheY-like chemotaxis protein